MAWTIRFSKTADKAIRKLDRTNARNILDEMEEISTLDDPRSRGKALTGSLAGYWRYRVGDYRIFCEIYDDELIILAVRVAHRSKAYKRQ